MMMLGNIDAIATIGVKDVKRARKFYEDVLGLKADRVEEPQMVIYKSGNSTILVYMSSFAGTNKATAVTWVVGEELEKIVSALKAKGAKFEHYDMPQATLKGDIHIMGKTRNAWLKDPDGNILSLVNG
jgi:catechol 2,3-dioxygenase-like lactoylglutathione lyase family enzyme